MHATVPSSDEHGIAMALLSGSSNDDVRVAAGGIGLTAMRHFTSLVKPQLSPQHLGTVETMLRRFVGSASDAEGDVQLPSKDFDAFCSLLEPLVELSPADMVHSYVRGTLDDIFRLLAETSIVDSPGTMGSSIRVRTPDDHALDDGNIHIRKEDLREYLEQTMDTDGKPLLLAGVDVAQLLLSGRQNDVYFDDFVTVMYRVLRGRAFSRSSLVDSIEERRRMRKDAKKRALEKIKAVITHHQEDDKLGAELRAAASPPRRRALSPFAFGSWRASQGAAQPSAMACTTSSPLPSPVAPQNTADASNKPPCTSSSNAGGSSTPPASHQYTPVQQVKSPRDGKPPQQASPGKPPSVQQPSNKASTATAAADDASNVAAASPNMSYDFSAHNAILDDTFSLLDVDQSGSVSLDAIYELCAAFPHPPQPNAIRRLFHLVDVNASNDIDREEFEQLCFLLQQKTSLTVTDMCSYFTTAMYRRLFELLDDEGDGNESVSREELRVLLEAISPILQASFSSADVYRLTREFETDQLNFSQFQLVVKQLIRGKSISKVVGAFEEVLRRRRLLKRQALERFAQPAAHIPPRPVGGKKLPPPPSGAPPSKGGCTNCSMQARRILELEEHVNTLNAKLKDAAEEHRKALVERDVMQHSYLFNQSHPNVVQCFAALDSIRRGGGAHTTHQQSSLPYEVVATTSAMDPSLLGVVARAATDVQWQHMVVGTLGGGGGSDAGSPLSCPLSGDRTVWADGTFTVACNDVVQLQRDLNALVTFTIRPNQTAVADAAKDLLHNLQAIVSLTPDGEVVADEALDALRHGLAAVAAARDKARLAMHEHHQPCGRLGAGDEAPPAVIHPIAVLVARRDALATTALMQLVTTSWHRNHAPPRGSTTGDAKASRGAADAQLAKPSGAVASAPSIVERLQAFYAASTAANQYFSLLQSEVSAPMQVERIANQFLNLAHVPIREADFTAVSNVGQDAALLDELLSASVWDATFRQLSDTLADVHDVVVQALQSSKKDKAVMVNTVATPVAGEAGDRSSMHAGGQATTPRGHRPPPSPHDQSVARDSSPFNAALRTPPLSHATSMSTRARSPSLAKHQLSERSPYHQPEIANRSSSPRLRSRRERPVNVRHNLDRLLHEFLKTWHRRIPPNFDRADPTTNIFMFGEKKIELNAVDNFITVKVGGGYLLLEEYCEKYGAVEMRRWAGAQERSKSAERAALVQAAGGQLVGTLRHGRSPSPALQLSPRGTSGMLRSVAATPRAVSQSDRPRAV